MITTEQMILGQLNVLNMKFVSEAMLKSHSLDLTQWLQVKINIHNAITS